MKKRSVSKIIILVLVLSLIVGVSIFFINKNNSKKVIEVYKVEDLSYEDYWNEDYGSSGVVRTSNIQPVYITDSSKIEKIYVKKGQRVKKGDPLVKYSTALTELELERKSIDIIKLKKEYEKVKEEYEEIISLKPKDNEENGLREVEVYSDLPDPIPANWDGIDYPPMSGDGSEEEPYLILWAEDRDYIKSYIMSLINNNGGSVIYVSFMFREDDDLSGDFIKCTTIKFTKVGADYKFYLVGEYSNDDPIKETVVIGEAPIDDRPYTYYELEKMKLSYKKRLRDINTDINIANAEYKKMKRELNNSIIYSEINGKVKSVKRLSKANSSTPIVVVSSHGGYLIDGSVSEYDKQVIKKGMKVKIEDYMSGSELEGNIISVSNMPTNNEGYGNNPNVTYYTYTVKVDGNAKLDSGNWVNLKIDKGEESNQKGYFMSQAFVLDIDGHYYVYKENKDKKLEKCEIKVSKIMDGMYLITSGLTREDKVAFPYGKNIKEGISTTDGNLEELYRY